MKDVRKLLTALKLLFGVDEIEDELAIRLAEAVLEVIGWTG